MRRQERGADPGNDFIRTIEIKNKEGQVVERKEVVSAKGLLHLAHKERLSKIHTRIAQSPSKENGETAIVIVLVQTQRGAFTGLGDANPRNVHARVAPHFIRMAETRALARALRAALDVAVVAIEELEDEFAFVDTKSEPSTQRRPGDSPPRPLEAPRPDERRDPASRADDRDRGTGDGLITDPQRKLLYRIAAERGHEADKAREWLHGELRVDSLAKVTRRAASAFIDRMLGGQNGHANGS